MKKLITLLTLAACVISCGEKKEKKDGFEMNRTKKEVKAEKVSEGVPVDLNNKGVGPVTSLELGDEIDEKLAAEGEQKYSMVCTACHAPKQRLIGPALSGVFERRSPEWVMNIILNPEGMLKEDPIAKALLKEYNNAVMTNSGFNENEARAVVEYLRTL